MMCCVMPVTAVGWITARRAALPSEGSLWTRRSDVLEALRRDLKAARYAAQRTQRQYDACDPENRLVAGELERRWNQALQHVREIEERIEQHVQGRRQAVVPTREAFENLAADLEASLEELSAAVPGERKRRAAKPRKPKAAETKASS